MSAACLGARGLLWLSSTTAWSMLGAEQLGALPSSLCVPSLPVPLQQPRLHGLRSLCPDCPSQDFLQHMALEQPREASSGHASPRTLLSLHRLLLSQPHFLRLVALP